MKNKRNWYGCYKPNGKMCVNDDRSDESVREIARKKADVDAYYAKMFEGYNDKELKFAIEDESTIEFCTNCGYKDDFDRCKLFREDKGRRVIR